MPFRRSPPDLAAHYREEGGRYLIEIKLASARQLFNSLDPSPFREKDLNRDAEEYIVGTVRDFPYRTPLKLVIYLPGEEANAQREVLEQAVHHHFDYRYEAAGRELRQFLLQGRFSLALGLTLLFTSLTGYRLLAATSGGLWGSILAEGLMIGGWVAMWRPLETYLYAWWPLARQRRIHDKLRHLPVEVRES